MPYDGRPWTVRFWEKVPAPVGDECMEWTGTVPPHGYGQICIDGRQRRAHRVMAELYEGQIPSDVMVCHKCDNPRCVRPDHLFLGTAKDNARDRQNKGRFTPPVFQRDNHPRAKLTTVQAADIRTRLRPGHGGNTKQLAGEFGVTAATISNLARSIA